MFVCLNQVVSPSALLVRSWKYGSGFSIFPLLSWSELLEIVSFLTYQDLYTCGKLSRFGFVSVFLCERASRRCKKLLPQARLLPMLFQHKQVALVSYPRSGNSFLRKLLESSTGIITGSDSRTNRPLCSSLLQCGFRGEGVVDNSVWVVKTHFPERMGYLHFNAHGIILLVRNPFDALESYFHMGMTGTHDQALAPEVQHLTSTLYLIICCPSSWHYVCSNLLSFCFGGDG